ncbi:MAG: tetratricopeptide repeat protein [Candidatus Bathyarchaeia archaeon]
MNYLEGKLERKILRAMIPPEQIDPADHPIIFVDVRSNPEQFQLPKAPIVFWTDWEMLKNCSKDLLATRNGLFLLEKCYQVENLFLLPPEELYFRARILEEEAEREPLPHLYREMAKIYVALGDYNWALLIQEQAVKLARNSGKPSAFAENLNNLGNILFALGRGKEALEATGEAVKIYRELTRTDPQTFFPYLATSLNNLGILLFRLGRREEALRATKEALEIYRKLVRTDLQNSLPELARSLNSLGVQLSGLKQWEKALEATEEAVKIYRELVRTDPSTFLPHLAMALNNLGNQLFETGQREKALRAMEEAVEIYWKLVEINIRVFLPHLIMSLHNLGNQFLRMGQMKKALEIYQELVALRYWRV